jgi:hypothetical protein
MREPYARDRRSGESAPPSRPWSPARWPRLLAAVAGALCMGGPTADAATLAVSGSCRDGMANGAFEARQADGRLRVTGAFAKGRRSGTFVFWNEAGERIAVVPYEDDAKVGTVAAWYEPAGGGMAHVRRLEAPYAANVPQGTRRTWHANGNPRTEVRYERGAIVAAKAWAASGEPLSAAEAQALARRELAADDAFLAALEALVDGERPQCAGVPNKVVD